MLVRSVPSKAEVQLSTPTNEHPVEDTRQTETVKNEVFDCEIMDLTVPKRRFL